MKRWLAPFVENISESTTACLVTMVQGNLLAISLGHLLIAAETGLIAGAVASILLALLRTDRQWIVSLLLGTATAVVDFFVHPGQFGPIAMEAAVTGMGAALLSYLVATVLRRVRKR